LSNHADIKNNYLDDAKFSSETDTEVIAQFLGLQIKQGKTMVEALELFGETAEKKASQWGLVIVDRE
jgi:glucosamine 6-phosphate synthetase-like amidotransferase/phosphosugar isomerase protein